MYILLNPSIHKSIWVSRSQKEIWTEKKMSITSRETEGHERNCHTRCQALASISLSHPSGVMRSLGSFDTAGFRV